MSHLERESYEEDGINTELVTLNQCFSHESSGTSHGSGAGAGAGDEGDVADGVVFKSTIADNHDMHRMGHRQELVRHYRMFSMVAFVVIASAAWEFTVFSISPAITDGGLPSAVWSVIWCGLGYTPVLLSMAEMASMAPIAGSQYHWVSEFAPDKYQQTLSYITGWTSILAWQAGNATGLFLCGTLIQSIILINNNDYAFPNWHGSLLVIAVVVLTVTVNIFGAKMLPYAQNVIFVLSCVGFLAFVIPIWASAPRATSQQVWSDWQNTGGWSSMVLAVFIGQLPAIGAMTSADTATHMAEEVRNASATLPKIMIVVYAFNWVLIFFTTVTLAYHMPDVATAMKDATDYPAVYVLKQAMSLKWVNVVLAITCALLMAGNVSYLAAVSRDLFAFARDNGLPWSSWISRVDPKRKVPINSYIFSGVFSCLLSLIYIGSPLAFYAITSLSVVSLLQCHVLSICSILYRRIRHPETLPQAAFTLGRYGVPINIAGIAYGIWSFFWCFWPQITPVTAGNFNWASPIYSVVVIGSMVYFVLHARKTYFGPVSLVEGRKLHTL